jgi:thiol-disulfide isomerase/thioredoxin
MEILLLMIRMFLFGIFALAAVGKILDREGSENSIGSFGVPKTLVGMFAAILPVVEIAIAVSLLFVQTSWYGAIAGTLLMAIFIAGMLYQISQGKAPQCHCFGELHDSKVGVSSVIRNVIFAAAAAYLVFSGRNFQGLPIGNDPAGILQSALLLSIFVGIIVLMSYLIRLQSNQKILLRNAELDLVIASQSKQVERQSAGNPIDALPIGAPFPDFVIDDANGKKITSDSILAAKKFVLYLFFGTSCRACRAMVPDIAEFAKKHSDELQIIIVSNGKGEDNLEKFGEAGASSILLQDSRELALSVNAKWTPTAIVVRPDGIIASQATVGDQAIRDLMQRFSESDLTKEHIHFVSKNGKATRTKIGESVPDLKIKAMEGQEINASTFKGKPTLAIFWSTSCPHCRELVPSMVRFDKERTEDDPQLILFSEGSNEDHRELGLTSPIVLEKDYKTAIKLGMYGTPSAVLINEDGVIVSEAAVGAPNIWALVRKKY